MLTREQHELVDHVQSIWAHSHAKATLAVLAMIILHQRPRWTGELQRDLREISEGAFDVDAQTLHRMLRRLDGLGLIRCRALETRGPGAARKVFETTEVGVAALTAHLRHTLAYLRCETFADAHRRLVGDPEPACTCREDGTAAIAARSMP